MSGIPDDVKALLAKIEGPARKIPISKPKYLKLKPEDNASGLLDVFYENPRTWKPKPGPRGEIHAWGLFPYGPAPDEPPDEEEPDCNLPNADTFMTGHRKMQFQLLYLKEPSPEKQFVQALMGRKREQLSKLDLRERSKQDVILKVNLYAIRDSKGEYRIWRRFRVSAGIKLSVFQDKVLSPIMGWTRNLHAYTFTDFKDGALYGPEGATSVDSTCHAEQVGYEWLPDHEYMLAYLFKAEGDKFGYLYDLGDKWAHEIVVETILPADRSDGRVEIIAGNGACPGENMSGPYNYRKFLKKYENASPTIQRDKKREILQSPNYKAFGKPPALFDPFKYDITWAKDNLSTALASTNSVRSGMRSFRMPFTSEAFADSRSRTGPIKKGQTVVKTLGTDSPSSGGFWEEVSSEKKDRKAVSACALCGKPGTAELVLKTCGGCRQMLYCSPEHQKVCVVSVQSDWV
ncbi:hypothetical protein V5O48_017824 [Marasmius crinis-equi]|uniref:MYND-type domain-containing protein n=1 Tax=Marasmius crinis-equi TaxID=585013 RepID=A0ABR3EMX0_9AGAR